MANILYPPPRPQSVGEILDTAFRIFGRTLFKCVPYAILAVILRQLPNIYLLARGRRLLLAKAWSDPNYWLLNVTGMLVGLTLAAAILLRQYAIATGHAPAMRSELTTALRRLPGVVLLVILLIVGLSIALLPVLLATLFSGGWRLLLGLLLAAPACCLLLAVSSAWPIMLVTGMSAVDSLVHSARLTWGSWLRLTLIFTVALVLLLVLYLLTGMVAGLLVAVLGRADFVMITAISAVVVIIVSAVSAPFYSGMMLAVLGDLSVRKEGADLEQRIAAPATP